MSEGQRKLAAIMFTDMVGYTALTQSDESQAMEVLERHNRLLRPFFPRYHGREVKAIGDSFLVEFESALDATECAIEMQSFLHDYNISSRDEWRITLRIGIHLGDVIRKGSDVFGDAVNIASRIEPLAEPEGVCVSEQVYDQVRNKLMNPLIKLEQKSLKNVQLPIEVYRVLLPWAALHVSNEKPESSPVHRLAVLPFTSMSPDPQDEYFADGMTEELISTISKISELRVISRTSIMQFKGKSKPIGDIGRELKAGTILEGSVRKASNKVRITVQLIEAETDKHLWVEAYDRSLEDVFATQSEIAQKVASSLKIRLLEGEKEEIKRVPTTDIAAYDLYLKGLFHMNRYTESELLAAKAYFQQAVERDPEYALAYASMAGVYSLLGFFDMMPTQEAFAKAEELARRALSLDESLLEAHLSLSTVLRFRGNFDDALKELEYVLELNPNQVNAHVGAAYLFSFTREFDKAVAESQKALELDPLSSSTMTDAATSYLYSGYTDRAIELYLRALELDPRNSFARGNLGICYVRKGMYEAGVSNVRRGIEMGGSSPLALSDLVYALAKAGKADEARSVISELVQFHQTHGIGSSALASAYASVGDREKAIEWLETAYSERSSSLTGVAIDFGFEDMRSDPRFQQFLKRLGLWPN